MDILQASGRKRGDWEVRSTGRCYSFVELSHPAGQVQVDTKSVLSTNLDHTVHPSLVIPRDLVLSNCLPGPSLFQWLLHKSSSPPLVLWTFPQICKLHRVLSSCVADFLKCLQAPHMWQMPYRDLCETFPKTHKPYSSSG